MLLATVKLGIITELYELELKNQSFEIHNLSHS